MHCQHLCDETILHEYIILMKIMYKHLNDNNFTLNFLSEPQQCYKHNSVSKIQSPKGDSFFPLSSLVTKVGEDIWSPNSHALTLSVKNMFTYKPSVKWLFPDSNNNNACNEQHNKSSIQKNHPSRSS